MSPSTILLAENNMSFLEVRKEFLEREGYTIVTANDPTDARRILEEGKIDLAVLDIRLVDDDDDKDKSGLEIAKTANVDLPIIIVTGYPTVDLVRDALKPQLDSISAAREFLSKDEGPETLLKAIREILQHEEEVQQYFLLERKNIIIAGLLFLAFASGVGAIIFEDFKWLISTLFFAILAILLSSLSSVLLGKIRG